MTSHGGTARGSGTAGIRLLAVDDERPALDDLLHMLRNDQRIDRVDGVTDAIKALRYVHSIFDDGDHLDGVFLDLRMPGLNGLDLARVLSRFEQPPAIVFVTAYDSHAVEAFELKALDYLLKPVSADRLGRAIDRIVSMRSQPSARRSTSDQAEQREGGPDFSGEAIPVEAGGITRFVRFQDIHFVEAHGDYTRLYCDAGCFLLRASMATLEQQWASIGFIRIHRSYLVAVRHIDELRHDQKQLTVRAGGKQLAVSRRHARAVREVLVSKARGSALGG